MVRAKSYDFVGYAYRFDRWLSKFTRKRETASTVLRVGYLTPNLDLPFNRSSTSCEFLLLDHRYVSSPLIQEAIHTSFESLMSKCTFHCALLIYNNGCKIAFPLKRAKKYREIALRSSKREDTLFVSFFKSEFRDNCRSCITFYTRFSLDSKFSSQRLQLF